MSKYLPLLSSPYLEDFQGSTFASATFQDSSAFLRNIQSQNREDWQALMIKSGRALHNFQHLF